MKKHINKGAVISALLWGMTPLALMANEGMAHSTIHPLAEVGVAAVMMLTVIGGSTFHKN